MKATRAVIDPRTPHTRRGLHHDSNEDGSITIRLRLPAERAHEVLAAVDAALDDQPGGSAEPLNPGPPGRPPPHGVAAEPLAARRADALQALVTGATTTETTLVVHVRTDLDDEAPATGIRVPTPRPHAWIENGPALATGTAARLTCTAAAQAMLVDRRGNPLHLGRRRRTVSRAQLRALRVRDRDRCVAPGCEATRHLQTHHVRWWRFGGPTDLDNLALVCGHHHTLIHDSGYRLVPAGPGRFTFTGRDGVPVPVTGAPTTGDPGTLAGHDHPIDDRTVTPDWVGEPLDIDLALAAASRPDGLHRVTAGPGGGLTARRC